MTTRIDLGDDPRDVGDDAAVIYDILHDVNYNLGRIAAVAEAWATPRLQVIRPRGDRHYVIDRDGLAASLAEALHGHRLACDAYKDYGPEHSGESHLEDAEAIVELMR